MMRLAFADRPEGRAGHDDFAGIGLEQPGNHGDGGGLAAPLGPEQAVDFAGPHLEADGVHRTNRRKGFEQTLNPERTWRRW